MFPIILTEHRKCWKEWYEEEKTLLKQFLPKTSEINHIGSTAISFIWAKSIIDILVEIPRELDFEIIKINLLSNGYVCMYQSSNRMSFNKGYTKNGFAERVFHLHLRYKGDNDELYFRDYLIKHPDVALEYERMKLNLWKKFEYDRDAYTNAKTNFVKKYTDDAKLKYKNKY